MKKNKMMRIASFLLVAVLLSTSIISGTFAKYVTSDGTSDSARVAKFGVVASASGTLFDKTYASAATNDADTDGLSVVSTTNVVAPGTKNDTGVTFSFTGTPEVDVKISFAITDGYKDVFLKGTGLPDRTTSKSGDTFDVSGTYYPIVYTLKNGTTTVATGDLATVAAALASKEIYVNAGTDLSGDTYKYTLTWEWPFGDPNNNKADTLLGDIAAGTANSVATTDYSTQVSLEIVATVAQVD